MRYLTKIDTERTGRGVTMKQLAQDAGLAFGTVKGLLNGKNTNNNPNVETILALCEALGISVAAIFATEDEVVISAETIDAALFDAIRNKPVELKEILLQLFRYIAK